MVIGIAAGKLSPGPAKESDYGGHLVITSTLVICNGIREALVEFQPFIWAVVYVLLWIAIQLLKGDDEEHNIEAKDSLRGAYFKYDYGRCHDEYDAHVLGVVGASNGHLKLLASVC